jgi:hypothetical protein
MLENYTIIASWRGRANRIVRTTPMKKQFTNERKSSVLIGLERQKTLSEAIEALSIILKQGLSA